MAVYTAIGAVLMWVIFGILHGVMPEKVPFDYTVFLGGIGGGLIAVLNFFLMGSLTVQKVAASADEDAARMKMKASYSQRMLCRCCGWWQPLRFHAFSLRRGFCRCCFQVLE